MNFEIYKLIKIFNTKNLQKLLFRNLFKFFSFILHFKRKIFNVFKCIFFQLHFILFYIIQSKSFIYE